MLLTTTVSVSPIRPKDEAVIVVVPKAIPFSLSRVVDVVAPCGITTVVTLVVAMEASPVVIVTKIPPAGAGCVEVTGKATCPPGAIVTFAGRKMSRASATVTAAVVSGTLGKELA